MKRSNNADVLEVVCRAHDYVDFWRVGKLNHNEEVEQLVNWPKLREDVVAMLELYGSKYYIKEDLRRAG